MRDKDKQILVDHYIDFYRIAYAMLRNQSDVEDAVQEALTLTMSRPFVRHPYQYCVSTVKSCCAKILSRNVYSFIEQYPDMSQDDDPFESRVGKLRELVDLLPQRIAELLELYYARGMTYAEIADAKGISESLVKKLIYRGHKQLRQQILELENNEIYTPHE